MAPRVDLEKLDTLGKAVVKLGVLGYGLTADREWVAKQVDAGDDAGSARRAYVRIMVSFIEGITHTFKEILIEAKAVGRVALSDAEVQVLREVQFQLDGRYRARVIRRPLRMRDSVRFVLILLGRAANPQFKPQFGDSGWQAFLDAMSIRNRVTHPNSHEDLWVTETDLDTVDRAVKWFEDETARFLTSFTGWAKEVNVESPEST